MLTLTATDADFDIADARERRPERTLIAALGASILLHALAIALLPGFRVAPPAESTPLIVELQQLPPEAQVSLPPQPQPPPPKHAVAPKPLPRAEPPPVIERIAPLPPREPEALTAPPPPRVEPAPQPPVAEPPLLPHVEPQPEVKAQPAAPPPPTPAPVSAKPATPAEPDPALMRGYGQQLSHLLAKVQRYPRIARMRSWQGTAEVKIHIAEDGKVSEISLGHGSGYDVLDREALDMVKDSLPLPQPPVALLGREFTINVPIVFKLQ